MALRGARRHINNFIATLVIIDLVQYINYRNLTRRTDAVTFNLLRLITNLLVSSVLIPPGREVILSWFRTGMNEPIWILEGLGKQHVNNSF